MPHRLSSSALLLRSFHSSNSPSLTAVFCFFTSFKYYHHCFDEINGKVQPESTRLCVVCSDLESTEEEERDEKLLDPEFGEK